ncbi:MAG: CCA tRNA nucleotidyltransferase, partial [Candidatus Hydrogenedentes bacterium]|nr:CCA tRNA nucleotidyltransferase [Candidatus Hydrogenedentota bacterium]
PELLELCRLDCLASHRDLDNIHWIERYLQNLRPEEVAPEPLIRGDDLIAMGYAPGPVFAEILSAIEDAQLEGRVTTPEEAKHFVREHWSTEDGSVKDEV